MSQNNKEYINKQLRVNLTTSELSTQIVDGSIIKKYLGGVGYGARVLYDELERGVDPLGPKNKLIFSTSPLSINKVPGGGSITICCKSPLTNGWGETRCGGDFGPDLKRSGYDHIILEGKSKTPVYLEINNGLACLKAAKHLVGKGVSEKTKLLKSKFSNDKCSVMCIGVGGEKLVKFAAIMCEDRAAGRGGVGAVMGSKNLFAIVVTGNLETEPVRPDAYKAALKKVFKTIRKDPVSLGMKEFGTVGDLGANDEEGDLPTKNWKSNNWGKGADLLDHFQEKNLIKPKRCYKGCPISCGRYNEVKSGRYKTPAHEGGEYETMSAFTAFVLNNDMDAAVYCDYLCNEYGLDSISCGAVISFAMECFEKGILTIDSTEGLDLTWGNTEILAILIEQIARRDGLGNLLADGVKLAADKLGQGSEKFAIHVKGMEGAAHDPRSGKALGVTYGTANRGMCHIHPLEGMAYDRGKMSWGMMDYGLKDPEEVDRWDEKGKGVAVKLLQDGLILPDILSTCKFMMYAGVTLEHWAEIFSGLTGWDFKGKDLLLIGERVANLQRMFNIREGFSRKDDYLPERVLTVPEFGAFQNEEKCVISDYDALLDEYYDARGWDRKTGVPTESKLKELGLMV